MNQEKRPITTTAAPGAIGPYSQAIMVGEMLYTSGQLPIDPATGKMVEGSIEAKTEQALKNIEAIVTEAGGTLKDVIKVTVYLADIGDFKDANEVYAQFFHPPFPARSAFQVAALPLGAAIEIEAIAQIKKV